MQERKSKINKIITLFLSILLLIGAVWTGGGISAHAEDLEFPFDETNVMDDLTSSSNFNLYEWPWDYNGLLKSPQIANFVEWCYSPFKPDDFALYIYFYNPQNLKIDTDNPQNRIQMASKYSSYPVSKDSIPEEYDTYALEYCSKSELKNYEGLFYKFRVIDEKGADGLYIKDRVYAGERRYDVSGVVLAHDDGKKVQEYLVGGTYYFEGYAKGYGPEERNDSTLQCTGFKPLETIELEVHPTVYRQDGYSDLGPGHQWDINSVYFSVPEKYFNDYGALQKIKAEWWEYETQPIFITKNAGTYNLLKEYVNVPIPPETGEPKLPIYAQFLSVKEVGEHAGYGAIYNVGENTNLVDEGFNPKIDNIYLLTNPRTGELSKSQVETLLTDYTKSADKGYIPITLNTKKVSADVFKSGLSNGRENVPFVETDGVHHKLVNIDANDKFDMFSIYSKDPITMQKYFWFIYGRNDGNIDETTNISPIEANVDDYIGLSDESLAQTLLISKYDVSSFKSFHAEEKIKGNRTVLFRFAQTDYFYSDMHTYWGGLTIDPNKRGEDLAIAWETVFLDFKIIQLTFQKDGEYVVIPVVHDPINIINEITKTPSWDNGDHAWYETLLAWVILAIAIIVGAILLVITTKILGMALNINNVIIKLILFIPLLIGAVLLFGYGINWVVTTINSLGGLL